MDIIEAMKERRSVRSYNGQPLDADTRRKLMEAVASAENPFGGSVTIRLKEFDLKNGFKPSTYGMIKGASDFFMLGIADDERSALSAGFKFEQVVLKAWQLGLGTCWIAATFKGTDFDNGEKWPDGERLRIISPVGVAAKKSLMEKIVRVAVGSRNRKPFGELFFSEDFKSPLSPDSRFGKALEMLRLAPSSTNSQPWRALVCGTTIHFYYLPKSPASVLDCGIGICHFWETERFDGRKGRFFTDSAAPSAPEKWKYLLSYCLSD